MYNSNTSQHITSSLVGASYSGPHCITIMSNRASELFHRRGQGVSFWCNRCVHQSAIIPCSPVSSAQRATTKETGDHHEHMLPLSLDLIHERNWVAGWWPMSKQVQVRRHLIGWLCCCCQGFGVDGPLLYLFPLPCKQYCGEDAMLLVKRARRCHVFLIWKVPKARNNL